MSTAKAKHKFFNDPIYGFISIPDELAFKLLEHPYFQRLRRIKQLGFTNLVYPGALHTRFHHAMGATHLMSAAIEVLRSKGHEINPDEERGAIIAILLHDVGHGPFSHSLEHSIVNGVSHENISELFMNRFNVEFGGRLELAIKILHQLLVEQRGRASSSPLLWQCAGCSTRSNELRHSLPPCSSRKPPGCRSG